MTCIGSVDVRVRGSVGGDGVLVEVVDGGVLVFLALLTWLLVLALVVMSLLLQ